MRRSRMYRFALSLIATLSIATFCHSQQQPQPMSIQKVKGDIYLVKGGSGANTAFYAGEKEVLAIDAKMTAESTKQEIEEIRKITPNPITRLVITHSDGDHVNGIDGFPAGLKIYGHPQTG